jgi:hypothetical protein
MYLDTFLCIDTSESATTNMKIKGVLLIKLETYMGLVENHTYL